MAGDDKRESIDGGVFKARQLTTANINLCKRGHIVGKSERAKEIRRRQQRKQKLQKLEDKYKKTTGAARTEILDKVRALTPGYESVYKNWEAGK